ncbi:MAG: LytTR family DNA-binding domain-containing protein [Acidobacteriota bacterium]
MATAPPLRLVLVDDEPLGRRSMAEIVRRDPDLDLVAECSDGESAVGAVTTHRPDLLLLDVQMPEMDGFEVLRRLRDHRPVPIVVFVTAYDEYAVRAFETEALDYVLKPFSEARLTAALARAKERAHGESMSDLGRRILGLTDHGDAAEPTPPARPLERLAVPRGDRTLVLGVDDIEWLEAADYYVRVHAGGRGHLLRRPLKWFEGRLDPQRFVRVHRSAIVNIERVAEIRRLGQDDHVVVLKDGTTVAISRSGREALGTLFD